MTTQANLEALSEALDAHLRAETGRTESRLFWAALVCGMDRDEPSVTAWASARVARWLVAA